MSDACNSSYQCRRLNINYCSTLADHDGHWNEKRNLQFLTSFWKKFFNISYPCSLKLFPRSCWSNEEPILRWIVTGKCIFRLQCLSGNNDANRSFVGKSKMKWKQVRSFFSNKKCCNSLWKEIWVRILSKNRFINHNMNKIHLIKKTKIIIRINIKNREKSYNND